MQVRELAAWVQQQRSSRAGRNTFDIAEVVRIQSVGMGDRSALPGSTASTQPQVPGVASLWIAAV